MEASLDTWTSLFLIGTSFGIFLSIIIFTGRTYRNTMLGLTVLSFSLAILYYVIFWTGYYMRIHYIVAWFSRFSLLTAPAFYLYIKPERVKTKTILLHLIPVFLALVSLLLEPYYPRDLLPTILLSWDIVQNAQIIVYAILIVITFNNQSKSSKTKLKKRLVYFFLGYVLCFVGYYVIYYGGQLIIQLDYAISFLSMVFVYYIGIVGFKHPNKLFDKDSVNDKYAKSAITENYALQICNKLDAYFNEKKPYLDGNLRILNVSNEIGISQHHISQALNMYLDKNFNDYVNERRFEHAKRLIEDVSNQEMRINEIAFNSGFNNKTTFNNIFKKHLGKTPKEYKEEIK